MPGIERCLAEAMAIAGALGVSLVEWTSGLALGSAGEGPGGDHQAGAIAAAELARTVALQRSFAEPDGGARPAEDVIISSADVYHLIRFVDTSFDSSLLVYLRLARDTANLAMARLRLAAATDRLVTVP